MAAVVLHGAEANALVGELHELAVGEDLKAAGVREDGPIPAHELVNAAELGHEVLARPLREVVGVVENDLGAQVCHLRRHQALDRGLRTHGHEDGGGNVAVGGVEDTCARMSARVLGDDVIGEELA